MSFFNRLFAVSAFAVLMLTLAGCSSPRMPDGRYSTANGDYVLVNNDLVFLHISAPQENPSAWAYWDWAGGYSLTPEGQLTMDMDQNKWKIWSFYYAFQYKDKAIRVTDKSNTYPPILLTLDAPIRR